ncbi:MAG: ComEC/Rec2 family competence protein [Oscillospiraceae bacterium]|jgi:competence protein ComEC|nr:ComEC/Rec2 family competence protein [Oscillospiraceae bacterium]
MDKTQGRVARPLAITGASFAAACLLLAYIPDGYSGGAAAVGVALCVAAAVFAGRFRYHAVIAAAAFILGIARFKLFPAFGAGEGVSRAIAFFGDFAGRLGESIDKSFPADTAPFFRAITIGDAGPLRGDADVYTALGMSGVAHIVTVSGMHVSFLISMLSYAVRSRKARAIACPPILLAFMAVTGFSPSVCRAVIMQLFVVAAPIARRRGDSVTSVFGALLLILLFDPLLIGKIGLQLSFLSTLGIVTISPRMQKSLREFGETRRALKKPLPRAVYGFITASFSTTLGALVPTTPLIAYYFGYVSMLAPVTNLVTLWAAAFCFCGGLAAGLLGLVFVPAASVAAALASLPAYWIIFAAKIISRVPFGVMYVSNPYILFWLVYAYAVFTAFILLRGGLKKALYPVCGCAAMLGLALLLTSITPRRGLAVTALDVGQGQSIVLSLGAATAVVDCGGNGFPSAAVRAAEYIQAEASPPIELLILTHFHSDHANGVPELLARETVGTLIIPDPDLGGRDELTDAVLGAAEERGIEIIIVSETMAIEFGEAALTIYPPFGDGSEENEFGLTILVTDGEWDALITGDMRAETELLLLEREELPDIELLVAGHHGSKYSNSDDLLDVTRPEAALVSAGARNRYGHPAPETLRRLEARGVAVYRTDILGNITIVSG